MKKTYLLIMLLIGSGIAHAQKTKHTSYKASNGVLYIIGDSITMNVGSFKNGSFKNAIKGGYYASGTKSDHLSSLYENASYEIKAIKSGYEDNFNGRTYIVFRVDMGKYGNTSIYVDIEKAIESCEVLPCNKEVVNAPGVTTTDKYEKLKQLKILLDEGVLTEDEFNNEKAKILNK